MHKLPRNSECLLGVIFLNIFPFVDNVARNEAITDVATALEPIPEIIGQFFEREIS
jgi:hypothetical protein